MHGRLLIPRAFREEGKKKKGEGNAFVLSRGGRGKKEKGVNIPVVLHPAERVRGGGNQKN